MGAVTVALCRSSTINKAKRITIDNLFYDGHNSVLKDHIEKSLAKKNLDFLRITVSVRTVCNCKAYGCWQPLKNDIIFDPRNTSDKYKRIINLFPQCFNATS